MLNIPSEDYVLRTEVAHCLSKHDITADVLTFRDQLSLQSLHREGRLSLTLVDHNVLGHSDQSLEDSVVEVIDHHKLERKQDADR